MFPDHLPKELLCSWPGEGIKSPGTWARRNPKGKLPKNKEESDFKKLIKAEALFEENRFGKKVPVHSRYSISGDFFKKKIGRNILHRKVKGGLLRQSKGIYLNLDLNFKK